MKDTSPRPTLVIGDLHGIMAALEGNLKGAKAVDSNGNWTRKDSDLVFLGDAICDRGNDDLQVSATINRLRRQVEDSGGTCTTIAGNHDMEGLNFLTAKPSSYLYGNKRKQFAGAAALAGAVPEFAHHSDPEVVRQLREENARQGRDDFLPRFKKSKSGSAVVEYLRNLDLYAIHNGTLFVHTPPTAKLLEEVLDDPGGLNAIFRKKMDHALKIKGAQGLTDLEQKRFTKSMTILHLGNRRDSVPGCFKLIWAEVEDRGIERIFFGHDFASRGPWTFQRFFTGVDLFGVDTWYGRQMLSQQHPCPDECAAVWLLPDGTVEKCSQKL